MNNIVGRRRACSPMKIIGFVASLSRASPHARTHQNSGVVSSEVRRGVVDGEAQDPVHRRRVQRRVRLDAPPPLRARRPPPATATATATLVEGRAPLSEVEASVAAWTALQRRPPRRRQRVVVLRAGRRAARGATAAAAAGVELAEGRRPTARATARAVALASGQVGR